MRVDSKAQRVSEPLIFILSPCGKGRGEKTWAELPDGFPCDKLTGFPAQPNMLWLAPAKNPPNCVFLTCHPQMPAVLTS